MRRIFNRKRRRHQAKHSQNQTLGISAEQNELIALEDKILKKEFEILTRLLNLNNDTDHDI